MTFNYFKSTKLFNILFGITSVIGETEFGFVFCLFHRSFKICFLIPNDWTKWRGIWKLIKD